MDLRSRTIPTGNRDPDDQSEFGEKDGTRAPSSPASTVLLEEDTLDFAGLFETEDRRKDSEAPIPQQPLSHGARDRDTSPLVRWQLPIRTPRETIANFDDAMTDFMDSERCPLKIDQGTETFQIICWKVLMRHLSILGMFLEETGGTFLERMLMVVQ